MKLFTEHGPQAQLRDTVFASDNFEDLTLLPIPPYKPLGARVVMLTYAEHVVLNPADTPNSPVFATDTPLYRNDPRSAQEVIAHWAEYTNGKSPEKTQFEINCEDFKKQLAELTDVYASLRGSNNRSAAAQLRNDLLNMVHDAHASKQAEADPQLRELVDNVQQQLALAA